MNQEQPSHEQKLDLMSSHVHSMLDVLERISSEHPDVYEMYGGNNEYYHLSELPLKNSPEEKENLDKALQALTELLQTSEETRNNPDRQKKVHDKLHAYERLMWGDVALTLEERMGSE